jgi:hypothetical protein
MEQTINYKGYTIEITRDQYPLNPRKEWDGHLGEMVCRHSRYNLGDRMTTNDMTSEIALILDMTDDEEHDIYDEFENSTAEFLRLFSEKFYFQILYLYDHGGISMSCQSFIGRAPHARWDSGIVGLIYVAKEEAHKRFDEYRKEWLEEYHKGKTKEEVINSLLEGEVEDYNQYLTGQVYCYSVEETGDGCCGFFGDEGIIQAIEDAKFNIDYEIERGIKKHINKLKQWVRNRVPLYARKPLEV